MMIKRFFIRRHGYPPFIIKVDKIVGINIHDIRVHFFLEIIFQLLDTPVVRPPAPSLIPAHMRMRHIPKRTSRSDQDDVVCIKIFPDQFQIPVHIRFPVELPITHNVDKFHFLFVLGKKTALQKLRVLCKHLAVPLIKPVSRRVAHIYHEKFCWLVFERLRKLFLQIHR